MFHQIFFYADQSLVIITIDIHCDIGRAAHGPHRGGRCGNCDICTGNVCQQFFNFFADFICGTISISFFHQIYCDGGGVCTCTHLAGTNGCEDCFYFRDTFQSVQNFQCQFFCCIQFCAVRQFYCYTGSTLVHCCHKVCTCQRDTTQRQYKGNDNSDNCFLSVVQRPFQHQFIFSCQRIDGHFPTIQESQEFYTLPVNCFCFFFHQQRTCHRHECQRYYYGCYQSIYDRQGQVGHHGTCCTACHHQRNEYGYGCQCGCCDGHGYFPCTIFRCFCRGIASFVVAIDTIQNYYGVIYQHTDTDGNTTHGDHIHVDTGHIHGLIRLVLVLRIAKSCPQVHVQIFSFCGFVRIFRIEKNLF